MRGAYAAWRMVEWHTFWRGEDAFQLASVVSSNYYVPIEYATADMQATVRSLVALGSVLGAWHMVSLIALVLIGTQWRLRSGADMKRTMLEILALLIANLGVLYLLAILLALPSNLAPKIDFRTTEEIHTNSLIWSSVNILPVAPIVSILAGLGQLFALGNWLLTRQPNRKTSS